MHYGFSDLGGLHAALQFPLLEEEDERTLVDNWIEYQDTESLNKLIVSHVKLVVAMAVKMRRPNMSFTDLVYEGIAGITEAAHRFDPSRGVRFSGYAKLWAKLYMRNYIFSNWSMVKIGGKVEYRNLFFSWSRLRDASSLSSDNISHEEMTRITAEMGVKTSDVMYLAGRFAGGDVSLDAPVSSEGSTTWLSVMSDAQAPDEDELLKQADFGCIQSALNDVLTMLTDEEREIVDCLWLRTPPESVAELSQRMGVTKESIRNVEKRALRKMKPHLMHYVNDIKAFLD